MVPVPAAGEPGSSAGTDADALLEALADSLALRDHGTRADGRLVHLAHLPARPARTVALPATLPAALADRLRRCGVERLYDHQALAHERLAAGRHTVVATGPASGKSLCYQLPVAARLLEDPYATALYLAPTKALARDQVRALRALGLPALRPAALDGDTPRHERDAIRRTANVVMTNPDMLHASILPGHRRWRDFLHNLAYVVVDECHAARGIFGAHVAAVLRRLRRVCAHYSAAPGFALASATIGNPAEHAGNLTGLDVAAITGDGAARPRTTVALWDPPAEEHGSGARRSLLAEGADVLSGLVARGVATLCFVRSRKAAEIIAAAARQRLGTDDILAYRAGLLAEERRAVEAGLAEGTIRGVAATDALELGVDIGGLDAVTILGWPGTAASFWQQAGRAGRRDRDAIVVFVGDDDPLDRYLLGSPAALLGRPLEAATADVSNPYVLRPHLRCAAAELPIAADEPLLDGGTSAHLAAEEAAGTLRRRGDRWYVTAAASRPRDVSLRSAGGPSLAIVEADTGAVIGEVDEAKALRTVHPGAVYLHQGSAFEVVDLDLERGVAAVRPYTGDLTTSARSETGIAVAGELTDRRWRRCRIVHGRLEVTTQVIGYERRRISTGESLGVVELDLPRTRLDTRGTWITVPEAVLAEAGIGACDVAGAAHAAEHAAIGLLPLVTMCDRWDVGGLSTPWHPDTGAATIFVYDGYPGGAGIAERALFAASDHLEATREAILRCACADGCPSCVHSPKCGNGNEPLDKAGAGALLAAVLGERGG